MKQIHVRLSEKVLEEVEKYQEENGITSRNAALLELVRKGLKSE